MNNIIEDTEIIITNKKKNAVKKCSHGKREYRCKDCGGSQICEHGKEKCRCKECCANDLCEHCENEYNCEECGGTGICEHNRSKQYCPDCDGSAICKSKRNLTIPDVGKQAIENITDFAHIALLICFQMTTKPQAFKRKAKS